MVRLPFCFSLWIFEHNTAVTIPNTVTVATHSTTKEAVVAMKTPEEGEQRSIPAGDNVSCAIGRTDREQTLASQKPAALPAHASDLSGR